MKKTILVTGGLGFIGSNFVKLLLKKAYNVVVVDNHSYSSNIKNLESVKRKCKIYNIDINSIKVINILKKHKPSAIFNFAAETHVDRSIDNPENFIMSNVVGVYNLLESCKKFLKISKIKNFKFIHISTDEVYGDIQKNKFSLESDQYKPNSPYAASKGSSDLIVRSYFKTYNLPIIITNCCNNFGPNQFPEKLLPKMIINIINNKNLPIYGQGLNSREWIYVQDHCEALIKVFNNGKIGEFYNIGSNKNLKNLDVTKEIIKNCKKLFKIGKNVKITFVKDRPGHDIRYALNSDKIKKKLKWQPRMNFTKGIRLTINWYLKNKSYFNTISKKDITKRLGKG